MENEEISVFPVTRWDAGPIPAMGFFMWRPHYIASPMQSIDSATPSRFYALTPMQLRALAQTMLEAADLLEKTPPPGPSGPTN